MTTESFAPAYPIEFWPMGVLEVVPVPPRSAPVQSTTPRRATGTGPRYVVQCSYCGKQFRRPDTKLTKHTMKGSSWILHHAVKAKLIVANPAVGLGRFPRNDEETVDPFTVAELHAIVAAADRDRTRRLPPSSGSGPRPA